MEVIFSVLHDQKITEKFVIGLPIIDTEHFWQNKNSLRQISVFTLLRIQNCGCTHATYSQSLMEIGGLVLVKSCSLINQSTEKKILLMMVHVLVELICKIIYC